MTKRICKVEGCNNTIPAKYRKRRLSCSDECAGILRIVYKRKRRAEAKPEVVCEAKITEFDEIESQFIYKRSPLVVREPLQPMYQRTYDFLNDGFSLEEVALIESIAVTSVKSRINYLKRHGYEVRL